MKKKIILSLICLIFIITAFTLLFKFFKPKDDNTETTKIRLAEAPHF